MISCDMFGIILWPHCCVVAPLQLHFRVAKMPVCADFIGQTVVRQLDL